MQLLQLLHLLQILQLLQVLQLSQLLPTCVLVVEVAERYCRQDAGEVEENCGRERFLGSFLTHETVEVVRQVVGDPATFKMENFKLS